MTEADYRELITLVEDELRAIGAGDLADPDLYLWRDPKTGEARRYEPRKHLLALLQAFDRWLLVRDGDLYERALGEINALLTNGAVEGAVIVEIEEAGGQRERSLAGLPRFADLRARLDGLIAEIRADEEGLKT